jgi:hypothetical protein
MVRSKAMALFRLLDGSRLDMLLKTWSSYFVSCQCREDRISLLKLALQLNALFPPLQGRRIFNSDLPDEHL